MRKKFYGLRYLAIAIAISFILFSLVLRIDVARGTSGDSSGITNIPTMAASVTGIPYDDWWESASVWVNPDGWMNARAEIQSTDLGFGPQSLNLFIASYSGIYNLFDHANWWFNPSNDPNHHNTHVNIQFRTNDAAIAKQYADLVIKYANRELGTAYQYTGTYAWTDWRGAWVDITQVKYSSHINFPWFTNYINSSLIPRNLGGIAETIDVTNAGSVSAWAWPAGNNEVSFSFGFDFGYDIYELSGSYSGSHTLNMNNLIHTTEIKTSIYQNQLWVNYALPDVASITSNPPSNSSAVTIYKKYHPPPEPWVKHHYWDIDLEIFTGVYTALSVSFDYDFIPWWLESRARTELVVNHYGYQYHSINLQGEYAEIIDFGALSAWDPNVVVLEIEFWPTRENMSDSFRLGISYPDYNDHNATADALAAEIATVLGISYTSNHTESWSWWDPDYSGIRYIYHCDDFNVSLSTSLLSGSDVVLSTPAFENQILPTVTYYRQTAIYRSEVGQWINQTEFKWNPLQEEFSNPTKTYIGTQTGVTIDLPSDWGWSAIPYSSNYSVSELNIVTPSDPNTYTVYPNENNGWGWHYNNWEDHWNGIDYHSANLQIFTDAASLEFTDNQGQANGTPFTSFGVTFDYTFKDNSVDYTAPWGNFVYHNGTQTYGDHSEIANSFTFSGLDDHLRIEANDDSNGWVSSWSWDFYYWNGTDYEPRFTSSGIKKVSVAGYLADFPEHAVQFEQQIPLVLNWDDGIHKEYNISWDTSSFADGEWTLVADVEDNAGFTSSQSLHNLVVDNYDDTLYTIVPTIDVLSVENTTVSGTHTVRANIADDVGIFAAVITMDVSPIVLNDSDLDGVYEFDWNTLGEFEGSKHLITITAWDMDGHKTIYGYWLEVDNLPIGNAPTVTFVSPLVEDETLNGLYTFQVEVTDDHGISSVKLQIDSGASYSMSYNPSSGYYELLHDLSNEVNGYHTVTVTVKDIDENQHTITGTIGIYVVGGRAGPLVSNPPVWDGSLSDLPENLSDYIEAGDYLSYVAESGNIYFKVAVKDDYGIAVVDFTVSSLNNFDPGTGDPDMSDVREVFSQSLVETGTSGAWSFYEYTWDSTTAADYYYLIQFDVQDTDHDTNHLYLRIILEIDNDSKISPGFEIEILISSLGWIIAITYIRKRRRK